MMKAQPHPRQTYRLVLQGLMSAGEAVGDAVFAYCRDELGIVVNEMFGQTEINYVVGNCHIFGRPNPAVWGVGIPAIGLRSLMKMARSANQANLAKWL
jgi:acetyl-CoA synthetase